MTAATAHEIDAAEGYLQATGLSIPAAMDNLRQKPHGGVPEYAVEGLLRGLRQIQKERRAKRGPRRQRNQ